MAADHAGLNVSEFIVQVTNHAAHQILIDAGLNLPDVQQNIERQKGRVSVTQIQERND